MWFTLSSFASDFEWHIFIYRRIIYRFISLCPQNAGLCTTVQDDQAKVLSISIFCFASILDTYLVINLFGLLGGGGCKNVDVDCVCETMIISAETNKQKNSSDDSFCTVIVTQVDLKTVMTMFQCRMHGDICMWCKKTKSCCITNKPIFCMTCLVSCEC